MHYTKALQLLTLKELQSGDPSEDYRWRWYFRWYSKTFHTPLHLVYDIPKYDIIQAYWEEHFEGLDETQLALELEEALKTDKELEEEALTKSADELETKKFAEMAEKEEQASKEKALAKQKKAREELISKQEADRKATDNLIKALGDFSEAVKPLTQPKMKARRPPGLAIPKASTEDPGEFSLSFTDLDGEEQDL